MWARERIEKVGSLYRLAASFPDYQCCTLKRDYARWGGGMPPDYLTVYTKTYRLMAERK
jgi:hypothetical protein